MKQAHFAYCDAIESLVECYAHFDTCCDYEDLEKFKGAVLESSLQLLGEFSDETEGMLRKFPIYTELVGLRNTTKIMYVIIALGIIAVIAILGCCYEKR